MFIEFTSLHKSHINTPRAAQVPAPRHQAHTPSRAHGAHRPGPARSVNLGAPPSRPVRTRLFNCPCQEHVPARAITAVQNESSYMYTVRCTTFSTEQSYEYRMTHHLYRVPVPYLHGDSSLVLYVNYGVNSDEVISARAAILVAQAHSSRPDQSIRRLP